MVILFGKNTCLPESNAASLARVFHRVRTDLQVVQGHLVQPLRDTRDPSVGAIVDSLLGSPGKRIRPALALLSARASCGADYGTAVSKRASISVAAAVDDHVTSCCQECLGVSFEPTGRSASQVTGI